MFSLPELAMYNGRDPKKPVYIAILGDVYDVTEGRGIYGRGGYYSFFSGRDASRAYVTGCFKTHLTHDVRDFDDKQMSVSRLCPRQEGSTWAVAEIESNLRSLFPLLFLLTFSPHCPLHDAGPGHLEGVLREARQVLQGGPCGSATD